MKDKTLLGLNVSVFLMMIGVGMIVAFLPQRIIDLDGHERNVGYLASMFAIAYIMLQVPVYFGGSGCSLVLHHYP